MRITVALTYDVPHWTGMTVVARRLAEGMAARGHDVTVVTSQHDPGLPRKDAVGGVRVVRVPVAARVSRTVIMPGYAAALAAELRSSDVVHLHTPMPEAALVAALTRARRRRLVITHHGDVVMPSGVVNQGIRLAMELSNGAAMRLADHIGVHTQDYADNSRFLAPHARRISHIHPPITMPTPHPHAVAAWRQDLGLVGRPLVGFAGRFVEEKGFDYLFQAIPLVREAVPEVHFLFAGDTDIAYERFFERCRDVVERQSEVVTRLGLLTDRQRMADFYAMCDVFVLPSRTDCFPIVQVEALLSGTPLVTTDIPGAREVVRRTGAGRVVRPRDPEDLAAGIVTVLRERGRYQPDVADVARIFDHETSLAVYERLLSGGGG